MMVPQAIASFIGMIIGGKVFDKFGTKAAALPGFFMTGASLSLLSQVQPSSSISYLLAAVILLGLGQGLVNMQVNNHALQSVPIQFISRVTPISNVMMQIVNSLAVAFLTVFLSQQIDAHKTLGIKSASLIGYQHTFLLLASFIVLGLIIGLFLKRRQAK